MIRRVTTTIPTRVIGRLLLDPASGLVVGDRYTMNLGTQLHHFIVEYIARDSGASLPNPLR
jgi:hypothetical protein